MQLIDMYNFRTSVYTENGKEYMSVTSNAKYNDDILEIKIPKVALSEITMIKEENGMMFSKMSISFEVEPTVSEKLYYTIENLGDGK